MKLGNIKQGALDSGIQTHSLSSVDPSFYMAVVMWHSGWAELMELVTVQGRP